MKNKNKVLDVVFILDKSGSMSGSEENTISSFNEYLQREKNNNFSTNITTILFSDNYSFLHKSMNIKEVNPISSKDYYVGGCTALYDAIGNGINYIDSNHSDKVLFIIITDGYENASREFNKEKIKEMIKSRKYEFIYIGADIDSYSAGNTIGISNDNIANYVKDEAGTSLLFKGISRASKSMMNEESMGSWKEDLESYVDKK